MKGTAPIFFMTQTLSKPEAMAMCRVAESHLLTLKNDRREAAEDVAECASIDGEIRLFQRALGKMRGEA